MLPLRNRRLKILIGNLSSVNGLELWPGSTGAGIVITTRTWAFLQALSRAVVGCGFGIRGRVRATSAIVGG